MHGQQQLISRKRINMAEFVLDYNGHVKKKEGYTIDHINYNHKDCRIASLRYADKFQQAQNRSKQENTKSKYTEVKSIRHGSKWQISHAGLLSGVRSRSSCCLCLQSVMCTIFMRNQFPM